MNDPAYLRAQAHDIAEPRPEPRDPAIQSIIDRLLEEADALEAAEKAVTTPPTDLAPDLLPHAAPVVDTPAHVDELASIRAELAALRACVDAITPAA